MRKGNASLGIVKSDICLFMYDCVHAMRNEAYLEAGCVWAFTVDIGGKGRSGKCWNNIL